jgi:hypothetical protein
MKYVNNLEPIYTASYLFKFNLLARMSTNALLRMVKNV